MNTVRKVIGIKVINCPVCRHLIYPGDSFCYNCGHFINEELKYVYEDEERIMKLFDKVKCKGFYSKVQCCPIVREKFKGLLEEGE